MRIIFILFVIAFLASSCNREATSTNVHNPEPTGLSGEELAKIHCGSCHVFPEPKALPRAIWLSGILPKMALRLGMGDYMSEFMNYGHDEMMAVIGSGVYPENPLMAAIDWEKIVKYYEQNSTDSLPEMGKFKTNELSNFILKEHKIKDPEIVLTKYDSAKGELYVGSTSSNNVYQLSRNGSVSKSFVGKSPVVDIEYHKHLGRVSLEVGILNPSDLSEGRLMANNKVLLEKLHRPVHLGLADLNSDGFEDFIVSNFGNLFGSLAWFDGKTLKENILSNDPGARVVYHIDFDRDGKKDILALMTQGRESIVFFRNVGNGRFEQKSLLVFPPYFGSSFFEAKDLDFDGDLDFVYTNGDNADLSIIKKPFHGVRIYINNGKDGFQESYFYPINGASKVIAEDFDGDKDLDMAVISFFPDKSKEEGFLYFEAQQGLEFEVYSKKKISDHKWLTMDSGDFDNDGDTDIILGAFNRNLRYKPKVSSVVILDNIKKK
jgi:hypothetical protein